MAFFATPFVIFLIPIVAIIGFFFSQMVQAISASSSEAEKHCSDNQLKIALAQRGMSAAEIERVVAARPGMELADVTVAEEQSRASGALPPNKYHSRSA